MCVSLVERSSLLLTSHSVLKHKKKEEGKRVMSKAVQMCACGGSYAKCQEKGLLLIEEEQEQQHQLSLSQSPFS